MINPARALRQCDCCGKMKSNCANTMAYGIDTTACEDCRNSNPAGLSRESRRISNEDPLPPTPIPPRRSLGLKRR